MSNERSIGGLWKKETPKARFLSGNIEINGVKHSIVVFANRNKKDKQPDFQIFLSKPKSDAPPVERQRPAPGFVEDDLAY